VDSADSFASFLAARRLRVTSERLAIAGGVAATGGHFDVDSLLADLRRRRVAVSRATLYRTLSHLLQAGLVRRVRGPDGSPRYESMAGRRPHHHMVCLGCGAILEFTDGRLETLQRHACRRRGFTMTDHSLRIEGFCRRCAAARER
jgi:Fur family ferric uptake transcriptional regulator